MRQAKKVGEEPRNSGPPKLSIEAHENMMISLATSLAEKQLREGTASAQVITHYLKLGTTREKLEQEKLHRENSLLEAKTKSLGDTAEVKRLYDEAISAFKGYRGHIFDEDDYDEDSDLY